MSAILYANNATTTIAGSINNITTTIALAPGSGALFPAVGAGQFFMGTLTDAATGLVNEIVTVTARATDTLTVLRGQEGTSAQAWQAGDNFSNLVTAGSLGNFMQTATYAGSPNGAVTSGKIGETVWDTTHNLMWVAGSAGVNNAWTAQNPWVNTATPIVVPNTNTYTTIFNNNIQGLFFVTGTILGSPGFADVVPFSQFASLNALQASAVGTGTRTYRSKPSTGELQMAITGAAGDATVTVYAVNQQIQLFS